MEEIMNDEYRCKGGGSIVSITVIEASDLKRDKDGNLRLKRKYGKFKRRVTTFDFREPEIIGLA